MSRFKLLGIALVLALALVISMGIASGGESEPQTPPPSTTQPVMPLPQVTPLAGFTVGSPSQSGITDVRLPIILTNTTDRILPADLSAFEDLDFFVVDSTSTAHPLDWMRPQRAALANHSVRFLEPSMAARWTLGFQVPTATATDLQLEVRAGGATDRWQISSLGSDLPPNALADTAAGTAFVDQGFEWQPNVSAMATGVGTLLCGDPTVEAVTQVVGVAFEVENDTTADLVWPGTFDIEGMPVAQWADGTAADMSREASLPGSEGLPSVSSFAVRIPARTTAAQILYFASPRDGRFADLTTLPLGIMVNPGGSSTWISLAGVEPAVHMDDDLCALGFLGGPVPFGHTPRAQFEVTRTTDPIEPPAPEVPQPGDADDAARSAIADGLIAAAAYYDGAGQTFEDVTALGLAGYADELEFVRFEVGDAAPTTQGLLYFAMPRGDQFIYLVTQSGSGRWFCAGLVPHGPVVAYDGEDLGDIEPICLGEQSLIGG